jgi:hypothetical protein
MWIFHNNETGTEFKVELHLDWEVNGAALSDNYTPRDVGARDLWNTWFEAYGRRPHTKLGAGWATINWSVSGPASSAIFEAAPFVYNDAGTTNESFLDYFSWPVHEQTSERLQWSALPVLDKRWTLEQADKGGFFQEATGWKPSPYQPLIHLPSLAQAAGLPY